MGRVVVQAVGRNFTCVYSDEVQSVVTTPFQGSKCKWPAAGADRCGSVDVLLLGGTRWMYAGCAVCDNRSAALSSAAEMGRTVNLARPQPARVLLVQHDADT